MSWRTVALCCNESQILSRPILEEGKDKVKFATEALTDLRKRQMKMELVQDSEFEANVHGMKVLQGITETEAQMEGLSAYMKTVKRWCSKTG